MAQRLHPHGRGGREGPPPPACRSRWCAACESSMRDWNVVVNVRDRRMSSARSVLGTFGRAERSGFFNVLVMHVDDGRAMLDALRALPEAQTHVLSRVVPVTRT